jgi:hypothetical protein
LSVTVIVHVPSPVGVTVNVLENLGLPSGATGRAEVGLTVAQLVLLELAVKVVAYWTVATKVGFASGQVMVSAAGVTVSD